MKKGLLGKIWYFLWKDDSMWSWLANIVIAFILIKFVIYPLLGLVFGTQFPIVAVVSGSMEHDGTFDDWWNDQKSWYENNGITKEDFLNYPLKNGFDCGDLIILFGKDPKDIRAGEVIVFFEKSGKPIIHRVVNIDETNSRIFQTKGDHNFDSGSMDKNIREETIVGKASFSIPFLGYVKLMAVELLESIGVIDEQLTCFD